MTFKVSPSIACSDSNYSIDHGYAMHGAKCEELLPPFYYRNYPGYED
jgi:hypothetical protein